MSNSYSKTIKTLEEYDDIFLIWSTLSTLYGIAMSNQK